MPSSPEWLQKVLREQHMRTPSEESGVSMGKKWTYGLTPVHWCWESYWRRMRPCWKMCIGCSSQTMPSISTSWVGCWGERCQPSTAVAGKEVDLCTDSPCVYHWVSNILSGKAKIHTKAASEMLIRWRLDTLKSLVSEYDLTVSITLVALYCNFANLFTWVHCKWYVVVKMGAKLGGHTCIAIASSMSQQQIKDIQASRECCILWDVLTQLGLRQKLNKSKNWDVPVDWPSTSAMGKERLEASDAWRKVGMDINHYASILQQLSCLLWMRHTEKNFGQ